MSEEFTADDDFDRIFNHVMTAEPELLGSVTASDTRLEITADEDADWTTFKQAVRVASDSAPEEPHYTGFDEDGRLAVVKPE